MPVIFRNLVPVIFRTGAGAGGKQTLGAGAGVGDTETFGAGAVVRACFRVPVPLCFPNGNSKYRLELESKLRKLRKAIRNSVFGIVKANYSE